MTPAQSPPVAALPDEPPVFEFDIDEGEGDHAEWFVNSSAYRDLRAVASGLASENQRLKSVIAEIDHEVRDNSLSVEYDYNCGHHDWKEAIRICDTIADIIEKSVDDNEAAEASAQSAVARAGELERDAMRYRQIRDDARFNTRFREQNEPRKYVWLDHPNDMDRYADDPNAAALTGKD